MTQCQIKHLLLALGGLGVFLSLPIGVYGFLGWLDGSIGWIRQGQVVSVLQSEDPILFLRTVGFFTVTGALILALSVVTLRD